MGRLIVFEETGEVRTPRKGTSSRAILRRLTDAEVDALVTTKPADDERERFVRECAMRFMVGLTGDVDECVAEAMHAAESLAARLWEKRA